MSVIRVDKLESPTGTITFTGITTFSGTDSFTVPGGPFSSRTSSPVEGQIRYVTEGGSTALEYYNGTIWTQV